MSSFKEGIYPAHAEYMTIAQWADQFQDGFASSMAKHNENVIVFSNVVSKITKSKVTIINRTGLIIGVLVVATKGDYVPTSFGSTSIQASGTGAGITLPSVNLKMTEPLVGAPQCRKKKVRLLPTRDSNSLDHMLCSQESYQSMQINASLDVRVTNRLSYMTVVCANGVLCQNVLVKLGKEHEIWGSDVIESFTDVQRRRGATSDQLPDNPQGVAVEGGKGFAWLKNKFL